ncbi:hypothetical protein INR49_025093 [Caranx melampygus]|nr:hypothetical protein INR49_025093 [Caranx melampygus]
MVMMIQTRGKRRRRRRRFLPKGSSVLTVGRVVDRERNMSDCEGGRDTSRCFSAQVARGTRSQEVIHHHLVVASGWTANLQEQP